MFTVLFGIPAALIVVGVLVWIFSDPFDRVDALLLALTITFFLSFIVSLATAGAIGYGKPRAAVRLETHTLVGVTDSSGIAGSFFLASGYINGTKTINWIENTGKGMQFHSMNEEDPNVFVVEEDRSDGELDVVQYVFQNPSDGNWGIAYDKNDYIFRVPRGSVTTCYQLTHGASTSCPSS